MQKNSTTPARRSKPFAKGYDSRRHQFTQEERSKGFWTTISKYGVSIGAKLHEQGRWPSYRRASA